MSSGNTNHGVSHVVAHSSKTVQDRAEVRIPSTAGNENAGAVARATTTATTNSTELETHSNAGNRQTEEASTNTTTVDKTKQASINAVQPTKAQSLLQQVKKLLSHADSLWRQKDRIGAIESYDAALELAVQHKNKDLEGQILLGKGFALMQPALEQKQEEFIAKEASKRSELAINADAGLHCLRQAKAIAEEAGRAAQVKFVERLIQERGYFALPKSECTPSHEGGCAENDTDAIAKEIAIGDQQEDSNPTKDSPLWTAEDEAFLVKLVADHGAEVDNWDSKAEALGNARSGFHVTGEQVHKRWVVMTPRIRAALKKKDEERACGHTCGTCPTRSTCKLHDAVDLEVANDW